jgi:NADPH-dependent glutamate synthase beta subunit-like oxidoreductase/formate hydrogenlyase subunit 6/NADH:ubiquinone oxidoreductase subunit I
MTSRSRAKLPRNAVLVLGSGYGALKAAEDTAEAGIPVVWVTQARHFLELPTGAERVPDWPQDLDFQFRPLYLRVTRHPLVTTLTQARLRSVKKTAGGHRVTVDQDPIYVDYDRCTGCSRCLEVCPLEGVGRSPLSRSPAYCPSRALELDKRMTAPCRLECPLGVNVQAYMALTAAGRFEEALEVIKEDNPLPGVCGRVCHHPCEGVCRRDELDEPLAICDVKRFLFDHRLAAQPGPPGPEAAQPAPPGPLVSPVPSAAAQPGPPGPAPPGALGRVAIVGSGPAGLTAAHYLARAGFRCTVFEALPEPGGMLRWGIPSYRLPRAVLDAEIADLRALGVSVLCNSRLGEHISLDELEAEFDAVFLAVGGGRGRLMGIPGEGADGFATAVELLRAHEAGRRITMPPEVAVIGGGNQAIDAGRVALRLGAERVTLYCREGHEDMPADQAEVAAAEAEGIRMVPRATPVRILEEAGKVVGVEFSRVEPSRLDSAGGLVFATIAGSEFQAAADMVISAIGQSPEIDFLGGRAAVLGDEAGANLTRIPVDGDLRTGNSNIWAGGDAVTGPSNVVESMAQGKRAAGKIIECLTGGPSPLAEPALVARGAGDHAAISEDLPQLPRQEMAERQPRVRRRDFGEVGLGLTPEQAVAEAQRCLQCSGCCECRSCETVCLDVGAIDHSREARSHRFVSPAVIVADDGALPAGERLASDGFFHLGQFKHDLMDVMVSASAAAGQAIAVAQSARRPAKPQAARARDRVGIAGNRSAGAGLGIFLCTCNGTMASTRVLDRILALATAAPEVVHGETVFSACHDRGSAAIAAAVKKHRLDRVILASCACCPLEFQCISCNDQRTRTRIHLFEEHGLDRSAFEMINLRDSLSAYASPAGLTDDDLVQRARDLFRDALIRTRFLGPLRQGVTEMGRDVLVLGSSELGMSAASNLDLQGFRVRLVHRCRLAGETDSPGQALRAGTASPQAGTFTESARPWLTAGDTAAAGHDIVHVPEAVIEQVSGHIGAFKVKARVGERPVRWRADIVCLTTEDLLPLAIEEDLAGLKKLYRYNFALFHSPQPGLYRVLPRTLARVDAFRAGVALAAQVARGSAEVFLKDQELSPRVDAERCRGCGRCVEICPFDAVHLRQKGDAARLRKDGGSPGAYTAEVLRYNCVGCGGCVGRCPVTAMDMPYFSNAVLEELVAGALEGAR